MIYIYIGDSKFSSYDLVILAISKNLEQSWDRRRRDLKLFFFDISLLLELFFLWKISYSNLLKKKFMLNANFKKNWIFLSMEKSIIKEIVYT